MQNILCAENQMIMCKQYKSVSANKVTRLYSKLS